MKNIKFTFPYGKMKVLTLSYDDGVEQDFKFVEILNKYKIKCTFNLNSAVPPGYNWTCNNKDIYRINIKENIDLYKGHEVAIHTLSHPDLTKLSTVEIRSEVAEDQKRLEKIFNREIRGMAYPFGTYNDNIIEILDKLEIKYARTIEDTESFQFPENYLAWHPTCRHKNENLMNLAEEFIRSSHEDMKLFYLWGHSYEFYVDDNWNVIEEFCEYMGSNDKIWYATNMEIYDYMKAIELVEINEENNIVINNSNEKIWLYIDGELKSINSRDILKVS